MKLVAPSRCSVFCQACRLQLHQCGLTDLTRQAAPTREGFQCPSDFLTQDGGLSYHKAKKSSWNYQMTLDIFLRIVFFQNSSWIQKTIQRFLSFWWVKLLKLQQKKVLFSLVHFSGERHKLESSNSRMKMNFGKFIVHTPNSSACESNSCFHCSRSTYMIWSNCCFVKDDLSTSKSHNAASNQSGFPLRCCAHESFAQSISARIKLSPKPAIGSCRSQRSFSETSSHQNAGQGISRQTTANGWSNRPCDNHRMATWQMGRALLYPTRQKAAAVISEPIVAAR